MNSMTISIQVSVTDIRRFLTTTRTFRDRWEQGIRARKNLGTWHRDMINSIIIILMRDGKRAQIDKRLNPKDIESNNVEPRK